MIVHAPEAQREQFEFAGLSLMRRLPPTKKSPQTDNMVVSYAPERFAPSCLRVLRVLRLILQEQVVYRDFQSILESFQVNKAMKKNMQTFRPPFQISVERSPP